MSDRFERHMSDADALMWNIEEDPVLRSTIVAVALLDHAPDRERLRAAFERASCIVPRLRQRVVEPPVRLGPPRWLHEIGFDLDFHMRWLQLPPPGDERELLDAVAPIASASFDRARPLWECTVLDGLEGGRAALVLKVHHSVTDGVGGIDLLTHIVDFERDAPEPARAPIAPPPEVYGVGDVVVESASHTVRRVIGIGRRTPTIIADIARSVRDDNVAAAGNLARTIESVGRILAPATAPLSPLLTERGLGRRLDTIDVSLDDLKRAAKVADASLNDAFMAAVVSGLDRYHARHGVPATALRITLPINLRREGDAAGGNQFAPARFAIPLLALDPVERMHTLGELVRAWRAEPALALTSTLAGVLNRLPTAMTVALFGAMLKGVDFVVSNVPGAPMPIYIGGARIERFYAFGPPSGAALNVTLLSHVDTCCIGVVTDTAAVSDPDALVEDLQAGFDEIVAIGS
jgi:WS/DGAT/MGAT family acyltransferase